MILVQCAIKEEAHPIIRYFDLKYDSSFKSYPVYSKKGIALIISGPGVFCACSASSYLLSRFEQQRKHLLFIHIGVIERIHSSFEVGDMIVGNKVTSPIEKNSFYPDLLVKTGLKEAGIRSWIELPIIHNSDLKDTVHDIDAYGFSQSAFSFLGPHQIMVLKIISPSYDEKYMQSIYSKNDLLLNTLECLDLLIHKYFLLFFDCSNFEESNVELLKLHLLLVEHLKLSSTLSIQLRMHLMWSFKAYLHHHSVDHSIKQIDQIVNRTLQTTILSKKEGIREYKKLKDQLLSL